MIDSMRALRGSIVTYLVIIGIACAMGFTGQAVQAEDAYYRVPLKDVKITEGTLPDQFNTSTRGMGMIPHARVVINSGEAYLADVNPNTNNWGSPRAQDVELVARAPQGKDITGTIYFPMRDKQQVSVTFTIPSGSASDAADAFNRSRARHYAQLRGQQIPGGAWFRYQEMQSNAVIKGKAANPDDAQPQFNNFRNRRNSFNDTFDLFTGGRAVSENLQLDRQPPAVNSGGAELVDLKTLKGITVSEMDFAAKLGDKKPALDVLATSVPTDQHMLVFSSFESMIAVMDQIDAHGLMVASAMMPRAEDQQVFARYQEQLCLPVSDLARKLGPAFAKSVAVTGGDPYYPTGTDIAIIFEPRLPDAIEAFVTARQAQTAAQFKDATTTDGVLSGVKYHAVVTKDRTISSYLATIDGRPVVTNSLAQLQRLIDVQTGKAANLASLPEYQFFRDRYPLSDKAESGLLILSDATIRRWCSPRVRIGASRRVRAMAMLSHLQAEHQGQIIAGKANDRVVHSKFDILGGDTVTLEKAGVRSKTYNTIAFMTPIDELKLDQVTKQEADMYNLWRDGYQRNWSQYFDPIAIQFTVNNQKIAVDMTVMPLIASSEYNEMINLTKGATVQPTAGDLHADAMLHVIMALNKHSKQMMQWNMMATQMTGANQLNPMSWLGDSVSLYVDNDPIWAKAKDIDDGDEFQIFIGENTSRIPVAINFDVSNPMKLTLFMVGLRAYVDQTAPQMTVWETKMRNERGYVRVGPSAQAIGQDKSIEKYALYYAITGKSLVVSLSESLIQRAIDREITVEKLAKEDAPAPGPGIAPGAALVGLQNGRPCDGTAL